MSNLRQPNGDDYPEAAHKHLVDAGVLLRNQRYDGAGYHAGYVVECTLKTLLQKERKSTRGHDLATLSGNVAELATGGTPQTARYIPHPAPAIPYATPPTGWKETMRYRASGDLTLSQAQNWYDEAERIYQQSITQMKLDGVIR